MVLRAGSHARGKDAASRHVCSSRDQRRRRSSSREHQIKMPPFSNWMECFQTDSEIGFQFLPSDKLSPVANYSHCQLTLQPAPLRAGAGPAAKFAVARHVNSPDENRQENLAPQHKSGQISLCQPRRAAPLDTSSGHSVLRQKVSNGASSDKSKDAPGHFQMQTCICIVQVSLGLTLATSKELRGSRVHPNTN